MHRGETAKTLFGHGRVLHQRLAGLFVHLAAFEGLRGVCSGGSIIVLVFIIIQSTRIERGQPR